MAGMAPSLRFAALLSVPSLAVLLALGCGSDADDGNTSGSSSTSTGAGAGPVACEPTGGLVPSDLTGTYAYREITTLRVTVPGYADQVNTHIINTLLVQQTQSGTDVTFDASYCDQVTDDADLPVHIIIPDAFVASLQPFSRTGTFASGAYHLPVTFHDEGVALSEPETEALPEDPTDPRVVDEDGDGKPGLTLQVTGLLDGEIYVVQRASTELVGGAVSEDILEGEVLFTSEQVILGSDPANLKDLAASGVEDTTQCASTFRAVRIPDGSDCAYVLANAATLFP